MRTLRPPGVPGVCPTRRGRGHRGAVVFVAPRSSWWRGLRGAALVVVARSSWRRARRGGARRAASGPTSPSPNAWACGHAGDHRRVGAATRAATGAASGGNGGGGELVAGGVGLGASVRRGPWARRQSVGLGRPVLPIRRATARRRGAAGSSANGWACGHAGDHRRVGASTGAATGAPTGAASRTARGGASADPTGDRPATGAARGCAAGRGGAGLARLPSVVVALGGVGRGCCRDVLLGARRRGIGGQAGPARNGRCGADEGCVGRRSPTSGDPG